MSTWSEEAMTSSMEVVLVKLGGSLITDKRQPETAREDVIERLAGELAELGQDGVRLVLGHGSGSFGHHKPITVEVERTAGPLRVVVASAHGP